MSISAVPSASRETSWVPILRGKSSRFPPRHPVIIPGLKFVESFSLVTNGIPSIRSKGICATRGFILKYKPAALHFKFLTPCSRRILPPLPIVNSTAVFSLRGVICISSTKSEEIIE